MKDLTANYNHRWHKVVCSRREVGLDYWWNQIVGYFAFDANRSTDEWVELNKIERNKQIEIEKKDLPRNPKEFRYSKHYILPSMLKKNEGFLPNSKPLEVKFKDELIYEKSTMCKLYSKARWRREMRRIKKGEEPVKKVMAMAGQGEILQDLFGEWQTEVFENELNPDGTLPKNEYGNFEIFNGPLPKGVVYINLHGVGRLCKKLGIEYVEAVVGTP
jgi:xeroderma pigmentosum group C-complementing protein